VAIGEERIATSTNRPTCCEAARTCEELLYRCRAGNRRWSRAALPGKRARIVPGSVVSSAAVIQALLDGTWEHRREDPRRK
jgi:hypothetical protein